MSDPFSSLRSLSFCRALSFAPNIQVCFAILILIVCMIVSQNVVKIQGMIRRNSIHTQPVEIRQTDAVVSVGVCSSLVFLHVGHMLMQTLAVKISLAWLIWAHDSGKCQ